MYNITELPKMQTDIENRILQDSNYVVIFWDQIDDLSKVYRNDVKNFNPIHLFRYKSYCFFTQRGSGDMPSASRFSWSFRRKKL